MSLPKTVRLVEVGPRDGLQNEAITVPTEIKLELIDRLEDAGLTEIEVGSFVSPRLLPQMADTGEVLTRLPKPLRGRRPVLVANLRGLQAALAAGARDIAVFAAASESFSQKNINCSIEESLVRYGDVITQANEAGLRVRGYLSCVLGCPYEGEVRAQTVARLSARLSDMGCHEISLGDTLGTGTPLQAQRMIEAVSEVVPVSRLAAHFHDTYGQALANLLAVLQMGVAVVDASVSGLGGCPYAPGAGGNLATEDLLYMLDGMGVETGVDLVKLCAAGRFISDYLGRPPGSRVARALSPSAG